MRGDSPSPRNGRQPRPVSGQEIHSSAGSIVSPAELNAGSLLFAGLLPFVAIMVLSFPVETATLGLALLVSTVGTSYLRRFAPPSLRATFSSLPGRVIARATR